ncbi:TIGR00159 family protein [Williamwhitmania taraxaci]|uniref:Diadenylate cyclase n=2 Tax=Williamwhitmania taraxaci TaxID=1640674 RepID=A0A1G6JAY0_9BACT|nr:TIGR00159 family protein [Williamwhitmania taraxaci]
MELAFITLKILDVVDILLVAILLYQIYMLVRGTVAINIFVGVFALYLVWLIVKALNMELLSSILDKVIGLGVIALIIVFQQEIRRFLLYIGNRYFSRYNFSIERLFFPGRTEKDNLLNVESIVKAARNMSETKTGALIVLARRSELEVYAETGDLIDAVISSRLLENLFFKNSPLHDGAVIICNNRIHAARCVLPVTDNMSLPAHYGMRHRAAVGITEHTDAVVVIVSEETGRISFVKDGAVKSRLTPAELQAEIESAFAALD